MSYSRLYLKPKAGMPTILAIFLILLGTFLAGILSLQLSKTTAKAESSNLVRVNVTNQTSSQAVIYWRSAESAPGWVIYGERPTKLDQITFEERDLSTNRNKYLNHYVGLKDLKPNKEYFFAIVNNNQIVSNQGNQSFSFKTLPPSKESTDLKPVYGKIITQAGKPEEGAVAILTAGNAYPLSSITKIKGGDFVIALTRLTDSKTKKLKTLAEGDLINIEIISEDGQISTIKTNIKNTNPLPETIEIGNNYDFRNTENVLSVNTDDSNNKLDKTGIIYPIDKAVIPGANPLIKGLAQPKSEVTLMVKNKSSSTSSKVFTDSKGGWKMHLHNNLKPGEYSITATLKDLNNKTVVQTRNFSIAKSGEAVLAESTPSAVTSSPTSTPSPVPSLEPTIPITVTITPTLVAGDNITPLAISSISLIIVGIGLLLAF